MPKNWRVIGWIGILLIASGVANSFSFIRSNDEVIDMRDVNRQSYLSSVPANMPLIHLKKAAYYEGYNHYKQFKTKKGPTYPTDLFEDMTEPADKKEQKKIYDEMYEQGYADAKNGKHANVIKGRM